MNAKASGNLVDGLLSFNGRQGEFGLEINFIIVSLSGHTFSCFGSEYATLTAGLNFGEDYKGVVLTRTFSCVSPNIIQSW